MNARTGAKIGNSSAQELLERLLSDDELIAVLRYANDRKLDSDSEVYFLVSLLKVFAYAYDRMEHTVRVAEKGREDIEAAVYSCEQSICDTIADQMTMLNGVIANITRTMAFHANQFAGLTSEMKTLEKDLRGIIRDADGAFQLYDELKDRGSNSTLSRLFYDQVKAALDRQTPYFEDSIRMLIARESRKTLIFVGASFVVQVLLIVLLR